MRIIGLIVEDQTVAFALHQAAWLGLGVVALPIDRPPVETALAAVDFAEHERNRFLGKGSRTVVAKLRVVPSLFRRLDPPRLAFAVGILDHNAHAVFAVIGFGRSQDPYARVPHLYNSVDSLGRSQFQHVHPLGTRYRIPIERDHIELMPGKREFNVLGGAGVQKVEQDALAFFDPDRRSVAQTLPVDGKALVADLPAVGIWVFGPRRRRGGRQTLFVLFFLFFAA